MQYEPISSQVVIDRDELRALGPQLRNPATATSLDDRAANILRVAVAPHRAVVIEHLAHDAAAAIRVGWSTDGRATISTCADTLTITGTRLHRLPTLLAQLLRLEPRVDDAGRNAISTTAAALDDALSGRPAPLAISASVDGAWRASGGWRGRPADRTATVLDCGPNGLWRCEADADPGAQRGLLRDVAVHLQPVSPVAVLALLGDVVTGRTEASTAGRAARIV